MTPPLTPYARLVASGRISGTQSWSTGISMAVTGEAVTQPQLQAVVNAFRDAFVTLWSTPTNAKLSSINAADTTLSSFRGYVYANVGAQADLQAAAEITPLPGTGPSNTLPSQTAIVATLLTDFPGRSYRGRMYLPMTSAGLDASHQLAQTTVSPLATNVAAVLNSMNSLTPAGPFGKVVIAGLRGLNLVRSVRVDSEPDIQRRRADKIIALRQGTATLA